MATAYYSKVIVYFCGFLAKIWAIMVFFNGGGGVFDYPV